MASNPGLPPEVEGDLQAAAPASRLGEVRDAFVAATTALADGDLDTAVDTLARARDVAATSAAVREALGIACYHREDYAAAARELEAYRRLSGREDQNHLLADCARALGHDEDVEAYVDAMQAAGVHPERRAEGLIVLAGHRADHGDLAGASAVLERMDLQPQEAEAHHVRLWYLAADLAERLGDTERAREYFEAVTAVTEGYLDARERLAALQSRG